MILSERGKVKISGNVQTICAELEHLLFSIKKEIGEKKFDKLIKAVLKNVNENRIENLMNKKDINKILNKNIENLNEKIIKVTPKDIVIGVGCKKNTDSNHMKNSLIKFLAEYNIDINAVKEIGSIEIKKDEKAIIDLAKFLDVKFKTFSVEEISKVDYLYEKSDWVKKNVGVYSVSDPVAHLLSEGRVIINKQKYDGITFSIGRIDI